MADTKSLPYCDCSNAVDLSTGKKYGTFSRQGHSLRWVVSTRFATISLLITTFVSSCFSWKLLYATVGQYCEQEQADSYCAHVENPNTFCLNGGVCNDNFP